MTNEDETLWIVFNGEIYNFQALRSHLESRGHRFRSHTDTETILHLYEEHGTEAFARLRGMFALAIWDRRDRTLVLARDRFGKKPLFYHHSASAFVFGSEPKTVLQDPSIEAAPDLDAIHHDLDGTGMSRRHGPRSQASEKVLPGHWMKVSQSGIRSEAFWELRY